MFNLSKVEITLFLWYSVNKLNSCPVLTNLITYFIVGISFLFNANIKKGLEIPNPFLLKKQTNLFNMLMQTYFDFVHKSDVPMYLLQGLSTNESIV